MYLYVYSIFNVGFYVSCYLFRCEINSGHNVHLKLLRTNTDLYLYFAVIGL